MILLRLCLRVRRIKSKMIYNVSKIFRLFKIERKRNVWTYVQTVATVLILAYFVNLALTGTADTEVEDYTDETTKADNRNKIGDTVNRVLKAVERVNAAEKENGVYLDKKTKSEISETQHTAAYRQTAQTQKEKTVDKHLFQRLDTTPELTERLPFLPNYKTPCWEEVNEVFDQEVKLNCLPYFYVIGVSHCGTKDFYNQLVKHPLISGNSKAGNRWLTRLRFAGFPKLSDYLQFYYHAVEADIKPITTKNGYHNAIFGDFTPSIIWDNHFLIGAAKKHNMTEPPYTHADVIKHLNPNARIITLLCNPTDRLYADYYYYANDELAPSEKTITKFHEHVENSINKFADCLKNYTFKRCVYFGKPWKITYLKAGLARIEIGLYQYHLDNFMKLFPKNQILTISKESYNKHKIKTLQEVFTFLDVGNKTDQSLLAEMARENLGDEDDIRLLGGDMLPETRKLIQDFYRPYNERLVQMLGKDFDFNTS